jgi:hypothetical protein
VHLSVWAKQTAEKLHRQHAEAARGVAAVAKGTSPSAREGDLRRVLGLPTVCGLSKNIGLACIDTAAREQACGGRMNMLSAHLPRLQAWTCALTGAPRRSIRRRDQQELRQPGPCQHVPDLLGIVALHLPEILGQHIDGAEQREADQNVGEDPNPEVAPLAAAGPPAASRR